jgi:hypothetical protein
MFPIDHRGVVGTFSKYITFVVLLRELDCTKADSVIKKKELSPKSGTLGQLLASY